MAVETRVLTAYVPLSLAERVEAMALRPERSRGWVMKQALAAWIDQEEERHRLTLEALEDVDAGRGKGRHGKGQLIAGIRRLYLTA